MLDRAPTASDPAVLYGERFRCRLRIVHGDDVASDEYGVSSLRERRL